MQDAPGAPFLAGGAQEPMLRITEEAFHLIVDWYEGCPGGHRNETTRPIAAVGLLEVMLERYPIGRSFFLIDLREAGLLLLHHLRRRWRGLWCGRQDRGNARHPARPSTVPPPWRTAVPSPSAGRKAHEVEVVSMRQQPLAARDDLL